MIKIGFNCLSIITLNLLTLMTLRITSITPPTTSSINLLSTMFMTMRPNNPKYTKLLPGFRCVLRWRDTMQLSLLMGRRAPARLLPWRASSTTSMMNREESSLERSRISSDTSRAVRISKPSLWLGRPTSRYIMRLLVIF